MEIAHERVDTSAAMQAALQSRPWDLIIADYSMPQFSGPAALIVAREFSADVPFILVSGKIDVETAVQAIKAGADDYLLKSDLERLVPTVTRELRDAIVRHSVRENEARYRTLFEYAPDGIIIADLEGYYIDANPGICQMLGYTRDELVGMHASNIVVETEIQNIDPALPVINSGSDDRREWQFRRKDGTTFAAEVLATRMPDGNLMGMIRDITERKIAEKELHEMKAAAESANRAKSDFLANMSHEIRTPMTAIIGYAQILLDHEHEVSERQDFLQVIRRNGRHLLALINDVLDISKIEAGEMTVERMTCDVQQELSDLVAMMKPRAADQGLDFSVTFQTPIPRRIQSDPLRLRQILVNLLGNAIKFTATGVVRLRVRCDSSGASVLQFDVEDTGVGLTQTQIERLFTPFMQADESTTRRFGGTGLGLTISRRLARMLGGDVVVQSEPGVGSVFTATIEAGPCSVEMWHDAEEAITAPPAPSEKLQEVGLQGRILVADDGRDNQRLISFLLRDAGAEVTIAQNGREAVDIASRQPFDLILMDMQMPELDGYGATAELRRRGLTIPIVALTANAMSDDRSKCLASGCSDYVTKPIEKETFLPVIKRFLTPLYECRSRVASCAGVT